MKQGSNEKFLEGYKNRSLGQNKSKKELVCTGKQKFYGLIRFLHDKELNNWQRKTVDEQNVIGQRYRKESSKKEKEVKILRNYKNFYPEDHKSK